MSQDTEITIRGRAIREDGDGWICLDDIWEAAKARETRAPRRWRLTGPAARLIAELQKNVATSALKQKTAFKPVVYAKVGRGNKGTFAHPILAAAYAGYLSPKLEIEVREVWLRYRSGDATLADEILQRASEEENRWAGMRALARSQRTSYTGVLKNHGVAGRGYMLCTDAVYAQLLGAPAWRLRQHRQIAKRANLRDHLSISDLSFVMAAEALAAERIEDEDRQGNAECVDASGRSAAAIRDAVERDRRDRQRKLL